MPYLTIDRKVELNEGRHPTNAGELTYTIQQQIDKYLTGRGEALCFGDLATCLGALEAAKSDFTDRVLLNYERKKWHQHGDVWNPEILDRVL